MNNETLAVDLKDPAARTEHIRAQVEAMGGWVAPRFDGEPSCPAEEEFRRLVNAVYESLQDGIAKVREEIAQSVSQEVPPERVFKTFASQETLRLSVHLAQLYAVDCALDKVKESSDAELRHVGDEINFAIKKFERVPKDAQFKLKLFRQALLKSVEGPKTAVDAARRLLAMSATDLAAAAKECPEGWGSNLPGEWVTDMAELIGESDKGRALTVRLLDGKLPPSKLIADDKAAAPLRYLAQVLQKQGTGDDEGKHSLSPAINSYAEAIRAALSDGMRASELAVFGGAPDWLRELCAILTNPGDFGVGVRTILDKVAADPAKAQDWASEESNLAPCVKIAVRVLVEAGE